jgi:hypothetical protein
MTTRNTVAIAGRRHLSLAARCVALACLAGTLVLAVSGPASASNVPCWKRVLADSYSGHFDTIYPHRCYAQAIERIPTTLLLYSDTRDQIKAAENAAANHHTYTSSAAMSPPGTGTGAAGATSGSGSSSVPTAVIVLAVLAGLLLIVGGAGEIWRRTRRR